MVFNISVLRLLRCLLLHFATRDIKRRDTRDYLLATAGDKKIVLWSLNPFTGEVAHERVVCGARGSLVRDITALAFSEDLDTLQCATSTGDFMRVDLRSKQVSYCNDGRNLAHSYCGNVCRLSSE